jgi:SAM-dependent methyltransferase
MAISDEDITTIPQPVGARWRSLSTAADQSRGGRGRTSLRSSGPGAISPPREGRAADRPETRGAAVHGRTIEAARRLMLSLERVAGDLIALGPDAAPLHGADGASAKVGAMLETASGLAASLAMRRVRSVEVQLARLGLSPASRGLQLHIGSGESPLPGWINIDAGAADLRMDVRWGLPFADRSAELVLMSHVLEHFYYPGEALAVLKDVRRVLAPGGRLRVVVPDIEKCLRAYAEDDAAFFAARRRTWTWWPPAGTRLEDFLAYAGAGASPANALDGHKYGYDFATLRRLLKRAGFRIVERSNFMASAEPRLRVDAASRVAAARYGESYYSLFVEAAR